MENKFSLKDVMISHEDGGIRAFHIPTGSRAFGCNEISDCYNMLSALSKLETVVNSKYYARRKIDYVYVILGLPSGDDPFIDEVFSTKEKAEAYLESLTKREKEYREIRKEEVDREI